MRWSGHLRVLPGMHTTCNKSWRKEFIGGGGRGVKECKEVWSGEYERGRQTEEAREQDGSTGIDDTFKGCMCHTADMVALDDETAAIAKAGCGGSSHRVLL